MNEHEWRYWRARTMEEYFDRKRQYEQASPINHRGFLVVKFPDNSIYLGYIYTHDVVYNRAIALFEDKPLKRKYGDIMTSLTMYDKILKAFHNEFYPNLSNIDKNNLECIEICLCTVGGRIACYNGCGYRYDRQENLFIERKGFIYKIGEYLDFIPDWLMYYLEDSNIHSIDKNKVVYEI